MAVWRVGFFASPCEFTPRDLCGWNHRFDDPQREYRTIYAADKKETCLREVLADLKPNKKALADFKKNFGDDEALTCAGLVTRAVRRKHVLVQAGIVVSSGAAVDIESAGVLKDLSARLEQTLDTARIRGKDRALTRAASRLLYSDGHSGISFRSRLDTLACHALFEGRAHLEQTGKSTPLTDPIPELIAVAREYGLTLAN